MLVNFDLCSCTSICVRVLLLVFEYFCFVRVFDSCSCIVLVGHRTIALELANSQWEKAKKGVICKIRRKEIKCIALVLCGNVTGEIYLKNLQFQCIINSVKCKVRTNLGGDPQHNFYQIQMHLSIISNSDFHVVFTVND